MTDAGKLAAFRAISGKEVIELVKVAWPAPEGTVYYLSTEDPHLLRGLDAQLPGANLEVRLPARDFQEILNDATIADDKVPLKLWDGDGHISDLAHTHGAGQRVEIFYWLPQVELLISEWFGHRQPTKSATVDWHECDAEAGFLSSMLTMPRRGFYNSCSALFGGWLQTQAEIDQGDCPYNRHLTAAALDAFDPADAQNVDTSSGVEKDAGGTAWNAGARHAVAVNDGEDAAIEVTRGAPYACVGFSANPVLRSYADFLVALQWNPDGTLTLQYNYGANQKWPLAKSASGENVRVELRAGRWRFYSNGVELTPSAVGFVLPAPVFPLYMGVAIQIVGAGVTLAQVKIGDVGATVARGLLDPDTGLPFTDCPRTRAACIARGMIDFYLGFDTVIQSYTVGQNKGPNISVTTRGNESNLKRPLRVIIGERLVQDLDLMAFTVEPDTKHPEGGAIALLAAESEGPIEGANEQSCNGVVIGAAHLNQANGELGQRRTGFSPNVSNYSGTAHFFGRAQGDFSKTDASQLRLSARIFGLRNIRRYMTPTTFIEEYSKDRAWALLRCLTDKRWGLGYDHARFEVQDWIDLSLWGLQTTFNGQRTSFNAELIDRAGQQQINDICLAGRYCLPYRDGGKLRIRPLGRAPELFAPRQMIEPAFLGCLNREPDGTEFNTWHDALTAAAAVSPDALIAAARTLIEDLFNGGEYAALAHTDAEFLEDCYKAYFNLAGDPQGLAYWTANFGSRAHILDAFGDSIEFHQRFAGSPIPFFTDRGSTSRNIIWEDGRSSLQRELVGDDELPNRLIVTFDDAAHGYAEVPAGPFEDTDAQLRAGRAFGDTSRRAVDKQYQLLGVTDLGEATRVGNLLLHVGPFDEGGTKNNLRITFKAWFGDCLTLKKYDLIEMDSAVLERYGFRYFRVRYLKRLPNLLVEISAQAYPYEYYENIDSVFTPPPIVISGGSDNPGGGPLQPPGLITIDTVTTETDRIFFKLNRDPLEV